MKRFGILFAVFAGFILAGCMSSPNVAVVSSGEVGLYKLRSLDPVVISLLGIPAEKQIESVIDEKGTITLPYIDEPIQASGLTTSELERKIQQIYVDQKIYKNITANVMTSAKTYYVEGEVKRPQEYPLSRRITLLQAIAGASGYTEYANKKNITVTRRGTVLKFNAKDIEKHPKRDFTIEAGDRIKVNRTFY